MHAEVYIHVRCHDGCTQKLAFPLTSWEFAYGHTCLQKNDFLVRCKLHQLEDAFTSTTVTVRQPDEYTLCGEWVVVVVVVVVVISK